MTNNSSNIFIKNKERYQGFGLFILWRLECSWWRYWSMIITGICQFSLSDILRDESYAKFDDNLMHFNSSIQFMNSEVNIHLILRAVIISLENGDDYVPNEEAVSAFRRFFLILKCVSWPPIQSMDWRRLMQPPFLGQQCCQRLWHTD